jgi:acyl-CoA reductase-like NAD-dependent aldehyde dehydrogenase
MGDQLNVVNPATGELIDTLASTGPDELRAALAAARVAGAQWALTPVADRVAVIERFAGLVEANVDELAGVLTAETGKPITQARAEVSATVGRVRYLASVATGALASQAPDDQAPDGQAPDDGPGGTVEFVEREPLGVVANISAWNYPWFVGTNVYVPALLAGNAVLYKPSEYATLSGLAMGRLLGEAGVPADLFTVIVGDGAVGASVVELDVDHVSFTGSHATGQAIAVALAPRLVPVQLELGGKDPVYVTNDVDVATAAASVADGAFYNNGQSCCSVERIYVHADVAAAFIDHFVHVVDGFTMGDPTDERTYLGPLTRPQQAAVLEAQVAGAVGAGATVVRGGSLVDRAAGTWFAPTVLAGVTDDMAVMREESFGPVIGIAVVTSDDEAVERMNDTSYGLTAGVFSRDEQRARTVLAQVNAGSAYWNCCDRVSARLPWSGRKSSGLGFTLSAAGITAYTQPKAYHLRRG